MLEIVRLWNIKQQYRHARIFFSSLFDGKTETRQVELGIKVCQKPWHYVRYITYKPAITNIAMVTIFGIISNKLHVDIYMHLSHKFFTKM